MAKSQSKTPRRTAAARGQSPPRPESANIPKGFKRKKFIRAADAHLLVARTAASMAAPPFICEGAKVIGKASRDEHLEVTVRLRPSNSLPKAAELLGMGSTPAQTMSRAEFDRRHGASVADLAAVRKFARAQELSVVRESSARRTVILGGTVEQFDKAFRVDLHTYQYPDGTYRGRTGFIKIPSALKGIIEGVFGLDNRPVARRKRQCTATAQTKQPAALTPSIQIRSPSSTTFPPTLTEAVKS
jgi:subtilase family serine protease